MRSEPSLALRHIFFAERELSKIPGLPATQAHDIAKAGVVGGGTMGTGIAITFANAGIPVTVIEPSAEQIEKARQMVFGMFMHQVQRGRLTQEEAWKLGQSIVFSDDYADLRTATSSSKRSSRDERQERKFLPNLTRSSSLRQSWHPIRPRWTSMRWPR